MDYQAYMAPDSSQGTVIECSYSSALNRASQISEGWSAAMAKWESEKCGKHFSYRLKGKTETKNPVLMTRVKLLGTRFYRPKCGHPSTTVDLIQFGHREDDKCWWHSSEASTVALMQENLIRHLCQRGVQQIAL